MKAIPTPKTLNEEIKKMLKFIEHSQGTYISVEEKIKLEKEKNKNSK